MLNGLGLENFKAFKKRSNLPFKKLNVFLGPNSSGKSSFIKALMLLSETIKNSDEEPALQLSEDIGDFKSITYGNINKGKLTFALSFSNSVTDDEKALLIKKNRNYFIHGFLFSKQRKQFSLNELDRYIQNCLNTYTEAPISHVEFTIKQTPKRPNIVDNLVIHMTNGINFSIKMDRNSFYIYKGNETFSQPNIFVPYKFIFKLDEKKLQQSVPEEVQDIMLLTIAFTHLESQLQQFYKQFLRIEPFRYRPERTEYIPNFKYKSVGSDGRNTLSAVMGLVQKDNDSSSRLVKEKINYWLQEFSLAQKVEVKELGSNQYSLIIKNKYTGVTSNIVDVGVGTSQLLPIILETFMSAPNSVLAIEEPETHIHPNAQARLAEMFTQAIDQEKRFFIETHSMYFVQQLQILVAENKLTPQDVGIYYFSQDEEGSHIQNLEILPNGQFKDAFPSGFFDVAFELSKKLMYAAKKKRD
ncbi:AAA family ATPase [Bacillus mobilis]|uniref:AAA family ATPase n=1 Tax=Bacillus mobilis TaxID=2026190 RepID=UPI000A303EBA|nr:DUF3696 domain-containing protein [Bacillus mobilis]MCU5594802.1 DUF3696 domain-containing protein [Bacillus mobilis]MCU5738089.1 DUF3696 domain-containing protein [Bacillus mobilis]MCU9561696.1 DUF3696 domain-containing protein [Bacillus mobilis]SMD95208.1 hypothetical protein BACERE00177_01620 [Bacillus mobilis]HDR7517151.1 DUF3696 domain-containing protein [Bacillus mobilis]